MPKIMSIKTLLCGVAAIAVMAPLSVSAQTAASQGTGHELFRDPSAPMEQRVDDIVKRLTLDEKIACLGTNPSVPRLGIRGTGHVEGLHGLALGGPAGWGGRGKTAVPTTTFPQSRGLGQTWDPALLQQAAAVEAEETRYFYQRSDDPRGGLVVRAPNADLSRDPRWGRSEESYGEDPFLVGTLAVAYVKGLQGSDPRYWETASLMKHFLANSNEDGRDGSSSNFDERLFHEYYSVPFRMGIEQGGSQAFMTAYNAWNHIPMAANPLLRDVVM
jgi:beta-glucosidase